MTTTMIFGTFCEWSDSSYHLPTVVQTLWLFTALVELSVNILIGEHVKCDFQPMSMFEVKTLYDATEDSDLSPLSSTSQWIKMSRDFIFLIYFNVASINVGLFRLMRLVFIWRERMLDFPHFLQRHIDGVLFIKFFYSFFCFRALKVFIVPKLIKLTSSWWG